MNRMLRQFVVVLLVVPVAISFADDKDDKDKKKQEVPQGYEDAKKADAPAKRANVRAQAKVVDANVKRLEIQFLPRFKPLANSELAFVIRICKLDATQRKNFIAATDKVLKAAVREYATVQNEMQRGQRRFAIGPLGIGGQPSPPEPSKLIVQGMARVAENNLRPEQIEIYQREISTRNDYRKQVAVRGLVALLDEELILSEDQRKKLVKSLSENWQDAWVQSLQLLMNNRNQYLPNIPNRLLTPILSKTQFTVWQGARKHNQVIWGGFGGMFLANQVLFEIEEVEEVLVELDLPDEDAP